MGFALVVSIGTSVTISMPGLLLELLQSNRRVWSTGIDRIREKINFIGLVF